MKINLIDFGGIIPNRAHYNDAGADVFAKESMVIWPNSIAKIPLGIGLELPDGFVAFVLPRSGKSANEGITTEAVPIDSGYRGEIHAIVYNANNKKVIIQEGEKIAQIVIMPVLIPTLKFNYDSKDENERGTDGFGSTDKNREEI